MTHKNNKKFKIERPLIATGGLVVVLAAWTTGVSVAAKDKSAVERGRYLVQTTACNDCHTPGYAEKEGMIPESEWLVGDSVGWHGPWGTTYPVNLRARLASMTEKEWVTFARSFKTRPPMPFFNVNVMSEDDLKAIYQYVRYLGPSSAQIPASLPPGVTPKTPFINMDVVSPKP